MRSPGPCLIPRSPQFHLGPSTNWLRHCTSPPRLRLGPSSFRLHQAPSYHWLRLSQSSPHHHHGLPGCLLIHPSGSTGVLAHTDVTLVLQPLGSTSATRRLDSALVSLSVSVTGSLSPSDVTWASLSPCVTSVGRAQRTTSAPPSITATVGFLHHSHLLGLSGMSSVVHSLDSTTIHSSMGPSTIISFMAPPTIISSLVSHISSSLAFAAICSIVITPSYHPMGFQCFISPSSTS